VLAVLAMLAPKSALRVVAGGSDWSALRGLIPSPPLRAASLLLSGLDGKAGALTEPESCPDSEGEGRAYLRAATFLTGRKSVFSIGERHWR
jgi:hypothetical protein